MTGRRKVALAIALLADSVQLGFFPVFVAGGLSAPDDLLDFVVAVGLLITLGWRWSLVAALALELVPGVALLPSWTAFVVMLPAGPEAARMRSGAPAAADPPGPPSPGSP
ncbi:MAG: hypothetical protein ACRENE_22465 [Polyangiaceae bacterium]